VRWRLRVGVVEMGKEEEFVFNESVFVSVR
jgi:hypothetical protein